MLNMKPHYDFDGFNKDYNNKHLKYKKIIMRYDKVPINLSQYENGSPER